MPRLIILLVACTVVCVGQSLFGRPPVASPTTQPQLPTTLPAGWEEIDQRLIFFTVQLASVESSIDAVNKALKQAGYQYSSKQAAAERAQRGSEQMDRQGGGPVRWQEFYGRTAERFFYHPDLAITVTRVGAGELSKSSPRDPSQQNLPGPASIRPPQFDYIYRANESAQRRAEADAAKLGGRIDALLERRRQLEAEQAATWAKIAFQALASRRIGTKPLYRFDVKVAGTDELTRQRQEALRASTTFVRTVIHALSEAQDALDSDPGATFDALRSVVGTAASQLNDQLVRSPKLALDMSDPSTSLGRLVASADRLADVSRNVADSYRGSRQGDQAQDEQRKQTFRAFAQQALFDCATNVSTTSELVVALSREWRAEVDPSAPVATTAPSLRSLIVIAPPLPAQPDTPSAQPAAAADDIPATPAPAAGETDAAHPLVDDGWTILFMADDPLAWNFPIRSKYCYAVPLTAAPERFRYLRMRRMDTKEQVIIATSRFKSDVWPSKTIWFRGDKPINRGGCALGIIDVRRGADRNRVPIIDVTPNGDLAGWGFGVWETGASRQGYVWDGRSIDPTAFEISVTNRELKADERKHLVE